MNRVETRDGLVDRVPFFSRRDRESPPLSCADASALDRRFVKTIGARRFFRRVFVSRFSRDDLNFRKVPVFRRELREDA